MRFTLSHIIVFLASTSLVALASPAPRPVERNEVEVKQNGLLFDGYVAPGDGVAVTLNSTLALDEGVVARDILQGGKDILQIILTVLENAKKDNIARSEFTKNMIASLRRAYPSYNFVICHTKHIHKWDGAFGPDWGHWHREFDIKVGGTIGYEIYYARSGWFKRQGDGGFLNWAYGGKVVGNSEGGSRIVFGRI
ncbi:hypothetical protein BD779DRAFT_1667991 [Infundibulicybe gibba]|nr:hypothetical protein BD779DRAFT_1667991 [Infundibulicybe gibba]